MSISVILVEPEIAENIGFVARAMKCYAIKTLIIVGKESIPDKAYRTGVAARTILDKTLFYPTLEEGLRHFHTVIGFSRRHFDTPQECRYLQQLSLNQNEETALIFGRESQGLSREEILQCSQMCEIPTECCTTSLNLGQAVAIALYELNSKDQSNIEPIHAASKSRQAILTLLKERSSEDFLAMRNRSENLQGIISKINLTDNEVSLLSGIIKSI